MKRPAIFLLALCLGSAVFAQQDDPGAPRTDAPLTLLHINDVYSTVPINGMGGLARVATLKRTLAADGRTPLLVLGGDFLSPSVASTVFKGEQMIATLNAAGLDLATLGNHEFDFGVDVLLQRMAEAKWQWVVSNVVDTRTSKPVGGAAPYVVRTFGPLKVGFIGLCLVTDTRETPALVRFVDPIEAAATYLPLLRQEQVDAVVALTHLNYDQDRALAERFPEIDVIVGGHEHFPITAVVGRTFLSKAGSDARFVARIDLKRAASGTIERFYELLAVTSAIADHPETAAVADSYEKRLGPELDKVVATTRVPLDGVEVRLRAGETNLGNLVADALRAHAGSEIAMVNSGAIRGNQVYGPGPLTRRTLLAIHPFGNVVSVLSVPGRVVLDALNHGVSQLPDAAGQFPQVSGLTLRVDASAPAGQRVRDVAVGGAPLDPERTYSVAVPDFLVSGGDGYRMFIGQRVLVDPEAGGLMVAALEAYVTGRDVAPSIDGRITIAR